jgi:hypothetical protein
MVSGRSSPPRETRASIVVMGRALLIVAMVGCGPSLPTSIPHGTAVALVPGAVAIPNEAMEFRVAVRGVTLGLVQTAIGRPGWVEGRRAIILHSHGEGTGLVSVFGSLVWEHTTTLDLERGLPIEDRDEAWVEMAGKKDHSKAHHTWEADDEQHDLHSAIGALRAWRSVRGQRTEIELAIVGEHFHIEIWNAGAMWLASAHKPAVRYDGVAYDKFHFSFWISDDSARVPLAFRAESPVGTIAVDLVDYQVPPD